MPTKKAQPKPASDDSDSVVRFNLDGIPGLDAYYGEVFELDVEDLTVAETRLVKRRFKVSYRQMLRGIADADGDAIAAIIYIGTNRAGQPVKSDQLDNIRPLRWLEDNLVADEDAEPMSRDDLQDMAEVLDGDADPTG